MMDKCGAASERPNMTDISLLLPTVFYARPFAFVYDAWMFFVLVLPFEFPPRYGLFIMPTPSIPVIVSIP